MSQNKNLKESLKLLWNKKIDTRAKWHSEEIIVEDSGDVLLSSTTFANIGNQNVSIADSVKDFTNKQGANGWEYGYYQGVMNPSSFKRFEYVKDWDLSSKNPGSPYKSDYIWSLIEEPGYANFTQLTDIGGHPNHYSQGGSLEWAVRRWTSNINQKVKITGEIDDINKRGGGDGITARIFKNGSEVFSQSANNSSPAEGYTYSIDLELKKGDIIDFAIDPNGWDGDDTTKFTAKITGNGDISYGPEQQSGAYGNLTVSNDGITVFHADTNSIRSQSTSLLTDQFSVSATNGSAVTNAYYDVSIANAMAENNLIIDATSSGSIDGITFGSTASLGAYANVLISSINLGNSVDTATIADEAGKNASLTLDGGAGFDRLNGNSADNDLILTGLDKGTLDKVSFSNIENIYLQGGNDTVTIESGGRLSGLLDGGAGSNTLVVDDGGSITIGGDGTITVGSGGTGGGFQNFQNVRINDNGTGKQTNSLTLNSNSNNVSITGPNSGTADGTAFTNISDIDLAAGDDNATIAATGSLSGTLKGGDGNDNLFLNSYFSAIIIDHSGKGNFYHADYLSLAQEMAWPNFIWPTFNGRQQSFEGFEAIRLSDSGSHIAIISFNASTESTLKKSLRLDSGDSTFDSLILSLNSNEHQYLKTTNQLDNLYSYKLD